MHSAEVLEREPQTQPRRRQHPRQILRSLAYINLDQGNGGIIRDLTESGLAVQAVARLRPDQIVDLSFELLSPRVRVEARGRVTWADSNGQAGIQFLGMSTRSERSLKDWLLSQMFTAATVSGRDMMFSLAPPAHELAFSGTGRKAIVIGPSSPPLNDLESRRIQVGLVSLSGSSLSRLLNAFLPLGGVFLFWISSVLVMRGLPAWPVSLTLLLTVCIIFVAVYRILFSDYFCGTTPGDYLAQRFSKEGPSVQDQRFR
jgi:hypothetical protein